MTQIPQLEDYLVLIGDNNRNSFVGAGFIVEALQNYFVITATHVVADSLYIAREKLIDPPNEIVNVYFPKTRKWMISSEIKSLSPVFADDIAILRLHDQPQNSVPAVLGTAETLTDFTFVTAGSRLAGTRANGIVLGVELISRIKDKHPRFELLSSQIDRGMSGGPIVHSESNLVVGMTVSTWYSGNSKDQSTSYAATSKTIATNLNSLVIFGIEDGEYKLFDLAFKLVNSYESHDPERHSLFGLKGEFFVDMPLWEYGYEYVDETTIQFAWLPAKEKEVERKKGMIAESAIDYLVDWAQTPDKPYLTLLAEFGMGKSTILYRLEYILSKKYLLNYKMCPIRISLGQNQYLERSNISLLAKIKEAIKHEHGIEFFNKELKHLLNSRKLILLLDSFDEMSPELKPGIRMTNLDLILNDLKSANVKVIIASRDNYFYSNKDIEEVFQNLDPFF